MANASQANQLQFYPRSLNWIDYLKLVFLFTVPLPFAIIRTVLSTFVRRSSYDDKPLRRRIADTVLYMSSVYLSVSVMQTLAGSGLDQYRKWAKKYQPEVGAIVEELPLEFDGGRGEPAHLFWIGSKRKEKVLLYVPGGIYMFPVAEMMLKFWRYSQMEWKRQGLRVDIVVLSHSVGPDTKADFPVQLFQATQALKHILSIGYEPSDIQIVGDSSGGNLVTQLLSHMLHPFPLPSLIPPFNLPSETRLRGVYLMSPWVSLTNIEQWPSSFQTRFDGYQNTRLLGDRYIKTISNITIPHEPSHLIPYAEPVLAPDDWYSDLQNNVVDRVLVTAGKEELFVDPVKAFFERKIKPYHSDAVLLVQDEGIHDDVILDFAFSEIPLENKLTPVVLAWIAEGFRT